MTTNNHQMGRHSRGGAPSAITCECGNHVFANLSKGYVALVSPQDAAHLDRKWHVNVDKRGYVVVARQKTIAPKVQRTVVLAREILGLTGAELADHVDRNTLDNRRHNIRRSTRSQNTQNSKLHTDSSVGLKGVCQRGNTYIAKIRKDGKNTHLGCFPTAELAHAAYLSAAERMFGDFARAA